MKLSQTAFTGERVVSLVPEGSALIADGSRVRLSMTPAGGLVHAGGYSAAFAQPEAQDADWLTAVVESGAYIAEFLGTAVNGAAEPRLRHLLLRVRTYDGVQRWPEGRQFGVDETTVEDVNRHRRRRDDAATVAQWLQNELVFADQDPFVILDIRAGSLNDTAFRVVGSTITADLRLQADQLIVTRVARRADSDERRLLLALGSCSIVDATRMGRLTPADREGLKRLGESENAYLAIWDEYNALERQAARDAARDIGQAEYDRFHTMADGSLEFELVRHRRSEALLDRIGDERVGLEASDGVAFNDEGTGNAVIGDALVTAHGRIRLHPDRPYDGSLPSRGWLSGSYTLDRIRIVRRDDAQKLIAQGEAAPARQLALILADRRPEGVGRVRRHDPLSHRVREVLGGEPTPAQVQAIDLAINSRDLVLIQGPPGTGKTRVIAAIQARLAEVSRDMPAVSKRVLLTSYQHDAVSNLVLAADDGLLPPVKLGRAEGTDDEAYLAAWTSDLQARLTRRYANVETNEVVRARRALADRTTAYLRQPFDVVATIELLEWIVSQLNLVGSNIVVQARNLARSLHHELRGATNASTHQRVALLTRALRSTPEGYADDGPSTAARALHSSEFRALLSSHQQELLDRAACGALDEGSGPAQLDALKRDILDRLLDARARSSIVATMPAVEALLQRAAAEADASVARATTPIDFAVELYRDAVENQPGSVRQSIIAHTRTLAATCQQAASATVRHAQAIMFDSVIVDEAARANPLDLMIPISLAKERVVLVGDHRQLPQLLDDSLVSKLSDRHDSDVASSVLSRSLFERLFLKLRDIDASDGARRVITLDKQFRTHPVLGTFISEQFYAPFGERVENAVLDEGPFQHDINTYGQACCGWIDVPSTLGLETKRKTSISRRPESAAIVAELVTCLQSDDELTVGVITFYSGHVEEIWEVMHDSGLAIR